MATVQDLITWVTSVATELPDGLDTEIEIGLCDGESLRMFETVDVDQWSRVPADEAGGGTSFVLVRVHEHPDDPPPRRLRHATAHLDDELRKLTGDDDNTG